MTFRAGFVCIVGRPNTGKSTLTNALVGSKVAITSDKPQTTRRAIRGIVHEADGQIILVDTPGIHKPRTLLGKRLNELVKSTWADVDVIAMCFPADQPIGPGDRMIADDLQEMKRTKKIALLTKTDTVSKEKIAQRLLEIQEWAAKLDWQWEHIVPISSVKGHNLDTLKSVLISMLPESPALYPEGDITEETDEAMVAELIREAALAGVHEEVPHSIAVVIEEMKLREDGKLLNVHAFLFVERDSQKGIIIGKQGARLKEVGQTARQNIEKLMGVKVFLDLRVKVAPDWQRDPKQLNRLGF
ncbi:MAG: GTPase Era [Actinomycetota bacterium]|jgi:GTP-binding protein Era